MESSAAPVSPNGNFRGEFANLNPNLKEDPCLYHCRALSNLLTSRHRHGLPSCYPGSAQAWESGCFLGNPEVWKDTVTGLPVMVLHLYCKHHRGDYIHEKSLQVLAERGLWYATSNGSWVFEEARLVVIARADVIDRISLPHIPAIPDAFGFIYEISFPERPGPEINWKMCEAARLAEEVSVRNRKAGLGSEKESKGDYQGALQCYCETAYIDRTGGFHQAAREQLALAKAVIEAHPELDTGTLRFENVQDEEYAFYNAKGMVSPSHLEQRIKNISLPEGWRPLVASRHWQATAQISGHGRSGEASIDQEGGLHLWRATVQLDGVYCFSTEAGENAQGLSSGDSFCCHSPESAVEAAIDLYHDYERLSINVGTPPAEANHISGVLGEVQSSE